LKTDWDAIVVGAGPAGVTCAATFARNGLCTLLVEQHPEKDIAHAHPIELEIDTFEKCGLEPPKGKEIPFTWDAIDILSGTGKTMATLPKSHPVVAVRLDTMVRRILSEAKLHGATVLFGAEAIKPLREGNCISGVRIRRNDNKSIDLNTRILVDATGHAGALVRELPKICGVDFTDRKEDRIWAEARVHTINKKAALDAAGKFPLNRTRHKTAVQGGFSTLSYLASVDHGLVYLMAGVMDGNRPPDPADLLDELGGQMDFLGKLKYKGRAPIRLRRASLRMVCDGFAIVGEAAGTVIPMHASGVANGMLTGHGLAEHASRILNNGGTATTATLWPWAARYQRGLGRLMATYDAFRRVTNSLDREKHVLPMFDSTLTSEDDVVRPLLSQPLKLSLRSIPGRIKGAVQHPEIAARLAMAFAPMAPVDYHWSKFPTSWSEPAFEKWKKTAERLLP
jgi:digeranylgeranylglycerophospholipid reductase